mmetsp:Transcript_19331/g.21629  ORF Transcript_19331/g.21629 Transcript_19331/m.21629 type:complete len:83 (-) Transcript_19331:178-426(-)
MPNEVFPGKIVASRSMCYCCFDTLIDALQRTSTSTSTTTSTNTNNNLSSSFPSNSEFREQLSMLHNTSEATPIVEKERNDIP